MAEASQEVSVRLGTSGWLCDDWRGVFYPEGLAQEYYLAEYAKHFHSVEVDATFYGAPRFNTVKKWAEATPEDFIFSVKAPRSITHVDVLSNNCMPKVNGFLRIMRQLRQRLGPIVFQFPYFSKRSGITLSEFLKRLKTFLDALPLGEFQVAVEIRNKLWVRDSLLSLLAAKGVALVMIDHPFMDSPQKLFTLKGVLTGSFVYIRWLGDQRTIQFKTELWNQTVVNRQLDMGRWVAPIRVSLARSMPVYGYFANTYSGFAPADVQAFSRMVL
ncbi:MAG TPA: DUF72 domain-containing protein [Candidatus Sumerlaeota bacterium]|nr:DUF72 domain-containing protein [Candidatus Sumerlaeota bacterium]